MEVWAPTYNWYRDPPCIDNLFRCVGFPNTLVPKVPGVESFEKVLNEAVMVESGHLVVSNDKGELQCYENVKLKLGLDLHKLGSMGLKYLSTYLAGLNGKFW